MRKQWGLGFSAGYGSLFNIQQNTINFGPYLGIGVTYQPKILQW